MDCCDCGALVLAGGHGNRMGGVEKALLLYDGETMLHRMERELAPFGEKLLSTNHPELARGTAFCPVADRWPDCGPMEGIAAALSVCRSAALLVVPCDMPGYTAALGEWLLAQGEEGWPAWVCKAADGLHPLCGVYTKAVLPALERCLETGVYQVRQALKLAGGYAVDTAGSPFPPEVFYNLNTPEELADPTRRSAPYGSAGA